MFTYVRGLVYTHIYCNIHMSVYRSSQASAHVCARVCTHVHTGVLTRTSTHMSTQVVMPSPLFCGDGCHVLYDEPRSRWLYSLRTNLPGPFSICLRMCARTCIQKCVCTCVYTYVWTCVWTSGGERARRLASADELREPPLVQLPVFGLEYAQVNKSYQSLHIPLVCAHACMRACVNA